MLWTDMTTLFVTVSCLLSAVASSFNVVSYLRLPRSVRDYPLLLVCHLSAANLLVQVLLGLSTVVSSPVTRCAPSSTTWAGPLRCVTWSYVFLNVLLSSLLHQRVARTDALVHRRPDAHVLGADHHHFRVAAVGLAWLLPWVVAASPPDDGPRSWSSVVTSWSSSAVPPVSLLYCARVLAAARSTLRVLDDRSLRTAPPPHEHYHDVGGDMFVPTRPRPDDDDDDVVFLEETPPGADLFHPDSSLRRRLDPTPTAVPPPPHLTHDDDDDDPRSTTIPDETTEEDRDPELRASRVTISQYVLYPTVLVSCWALGCVGSLVACLSCSHPLGSSLLRSFVGTCPPATLCLTGMLHGAVFLRRGPAVRARWQARYVDVEACA